MSRYTAYVIVFLVLIALVAVGVASADITAAPISQAQAEAIQLRAQAQARADAVRLAAEAQADAERTTRNAALQADIVAAMGWLIRIGGLVLCGVVGAVGVSVSVASWRVSRAFGDAALLGARTLKRDRLTGAAPFLITMNDDGTSTVTDLTTLAGRKLNEDSPADLALARYYFAAVARYNETNAVSKMRPQLPDNTMQKIIRRVTK